MTQNFPKSKYTPSDTLEEGWTYVSIPEYDVVLATKISVTKVMVQLNDNDSINKTHDGLPNLFFQSTNVMKILSRKEYEVECQRKLKK